MSLRILLTGGAGFIGSHVAEALIRRGDVLTILDSLDSYYPPEWKRANLDEAARSGSFKFVEGDIRDAGLVDGLLARGVDVLVHLAARAGVRKSIEAPVEYAEVNLAGTATLLAAVARRGTGKVVFASSSSVYGDSSKPPFRESDPVVEPLSPYAATKLGGELLCYSFHHCHGTPVTALRFFTVYGPRQRPDMAIHKFTARILRGDPVPFFGDGSTRRDYTYVRDIVDGVVRAIDRVDGFKIYNLGESATTPLRDLVAIIEEATGKKAILDVRPFQVGDVIETCADISRAREELGYNPATSVREGVGEFVRWYRKVRA